MAEFRSSWRSSSWARRRREHRHACTVIRTRDRGHASSAFLSCCCVGPADVPWEWAGVSPDGVGQFSPRRDGRTDMQGVDPSASREIVWIQLLCTAPGLREHQWVEVLSDSLGAPVCGITGWVDYGRNLLSDHAAVRMMTGQMALRGPDAEGIWVDRHVGLGHRRLAVIDLVRGSQPMTVDRDGAVVAALTYSGEVYNFRELRAELIARGHAFRSHSDT